MPGVWESEVVLLLGSSLDPESQLSSVVVCVRRVIVNDADSRLHQSLSQNLQGLWSRDLILLHPKYWKLLVWEA